MAGESAQEQDQWAQSARRAQQRELRRPLLLVLVMGEVAGSLPFLFEFLLARWWLGVAVRRDRAPEGVGAAAARDRMAAWRLDVPGQPVHPTGGGV